MHVFVTGGTGLIGSAVTAELLAHGHTVLALVRSDSSAQAAEAAGATTIRGGLADLDVLREGRTRRTGSFTWPSATTSRLPKRPPGRWPRRLLPSPPSATRSS